MMRPLIHRHPSALVAVLFPLLLAACGVAPKAKPALTPPAVTDPPAPSLTSLVTDPGAITVPKPSDAAATTKMLEDRLQIMEYNFTPGDKPTLLVVLRSIAPKDAVTFESASEFIDAAGKVVAQTGWARTTLMPGKQYTIAMESTLRSAVDARVMLRMVDAPKPANVPPANPDPKKKPAS